MKSVRFYLLCFTIVVFAACNRVKLSIDKLPKNTPKGAQIYVTGSFNNWNPGDSKYLMVYNSEAAVYEVDLPMGFGNIQYKFTRGDWTTVETNPCGGELENRQLSYSSGDLKRDTIQGWNDLEPENCEKVVLVINRLPQNTPLQDNIYFAGEINGWQCDLVRYRFQRLNDSTFTLTIPRNSDRMVYKITRGTWETAELNENGTEQMQRELLFGKKDSVFIAINSWSDRPNLFIKHKTIVIQSLPKNTPEASPIYLVSNYNNWNPLDNKNKFGDFGRGRKIVHISYEGSDPFVYKITRGGWQKVEVDAQMNEMENREITFPSRDTIYIDVKGWSDLKPKKKETLLDPNGPLKPYYLRQQPANQDKEEPEAKQRNTPRPELPVSSAPMEIDKRKKVFIIIDKRPEFAKEEPIYLTGDFNNWNEKDVNYEFRSLANGKKYFILRLADGEKHEFKITRGTWDTEESNGRKERPENKIISRGMEDDTIHLRIESWYDEIDQKQLVILLNASLAKTPANEPVYLAGDFNNWVANEDKYKFKPIGNGKYVLTITDLSKRYGFYKISRGSWDKEGTTRTGRVPGNQAFNLNGQDTLRIRVEGWKDLKM